MAKRPLFSYPCLLFRIGLAAAQALGKRGAHVVVSSRRQANVDKAVALLQSQSITVTGTTCNVGKEEDREKLVQLVSIFIILISMHINNFEIFSDSIQFLPH